MKLTKFDILKILGYVIATCALLTPDVLHAFGLPSDLASNLSTVIGRILLAATLISNVIKNPSPPAGTSSAVIPSGSVPVVVAAPGTGVASVARADPGTILAITKADVVPPKQVAQVP